MDSLDLSDISDYEDLKKCPSELWFAWTLI